MAPTWSTHDSTDILSTTQPGGHEERSVSFNYARTPHGGEYTIPGQASERRRFTAICAVRLLVSTDTCGMCSSSAPK